MDNRIGVGVVGVGLWGQNILRNIAAINEVDLRWICDLNQETLSRRQGNYPQARLTRNLQDVLQDPEVQAVAIATPAEHHYTCAMAALQSGKHVFVEKPMALNADDANRLNFEAGYRGLKLMVGHIMRHHPTVKQLKDLIDSGELGETRYLYTQRVNLGTVRSAENAWWSLAPHDISMANYLFDSAPEMVCATGRCFIQKNIEDVVFATLYYPHGKMAHVHVSWLDPYKIRRVTVVGTNKMAAFDDMEQSEKLRIYDKSAVIVEQANGGTETVQCQSGDILIPKVRRGEPLGQECKTFIDGILNNTPLLSDGQDGLEVVGALEAGAESLRLGGEPVAVPHSIPAECNAMQTAVIEETACEAM